MVLPLKFGIDHADIVSDSLLCKIEPVGYSTDYDILMLSVTITTLPTLILFFTQQKRFVEGVLGSVN